MDRVIVVASNNEGKIEEIAKFLTPLNFIVKSKKEFGILDEVEETGSSFVENANLKAKFCSSRLNQIVLADDSGLEVQALNGMPGVYTKRFQEICGEKTKDDDVKYLLKKLENVTNRRARFVCALSLINSHGKVHNIIKSIEGEILLKPVGNNGFGYDPIFKHENLCFGEISSELKNSISHRGLALKELCCNIENWIK